MATDLIESTCPDPARIPSPPGSRRQWIATGGPSATSSQRRTLVEIREYWRVLRRRAWIPLVLMVAMVVATGVLTFLSRPEYTATATVLAKTQSSATPNLNFQDIATSNTLVLRVRN